MKSNVVCLTLKQGKHLILFHIFFQTTFYPKLAHIPENLFSEEKICTRISEGSVIFDQLHDPEMHILLESLSGLPRHLLSLFLTSFSFSLVF